MFAFAFNLNLHLIPNSMQELKKTLLYFSNLLEALRNVSNPFNNEKFLSKNQYQYFWREIYNKKIYHCLIFNKWFIIYYWII